MRTKFKTKVAKAKKDSGCYGKSAGEKAMGNMTKPLVVKESSYKQSKDGNGGK